MAPEEKMMKLERTTVGLNVIAGVALAVILALVADVRGGIASLTSRVEQAIRDVAVLNAQNLDARARLLESIAATNQTRIQDLLREMNRLDMHDAQMDKDIKESRKP